jgi:DNA-binding NarL/FixJ family response regulator
MKAKRVVLLSNRSLLAAGVQRMLEELEGLDLCVVSVGDPEAPGRVRAVAPSVIVVDSGDASLGHGVITRMLEENPRAKVIALNLRRADMEVYKIKRVQHADLEGLVDAIRGS